MTRNAPDNLIYPALHGARDVTVEVVMQNMYF